MQKLSTLLGLPQHRFASVHVVGTNGKSSVARMVAALLEAHGVPAGACVSPHAERWSERVLVGGGEIGAAEFAAAVEAAAEAAEAVNRGLEQGEAVTQFELATAAAFVALARARVGAAAIEAGLGGRLDATNTIPSKVTVLTTVGRDHTEWLGESEEEIAAEKLAVLRDQTTLVLGRVSPAVEALAARAAAERGAELIVAPEDPGPEVEVLAPGRFQRRNFALAATAAAAFLGRELDSERVAGVAAGLRIPGRLERLGDDPPVLLDAAHNPDGAAALAEALPEAAEGRPVTAVLAILADKDAAAMIEALAPVTSEAICTELPGGTSGQFAPGYGGKSTSRRSVGAGELARLCEAAGVRAEAAPELAAGIALGRARAAQRGGALLIAGSHYLLAPARAALGLGPG